MNCSGDTALEPTEAQAAGQDGNLYAGGATTNHIARWDGSSVSWSPLGSGVNGAVASLAVDCGGNLYVGAYFTTAGGKASSYIAR